MEVAPTSLDIGKLPVPRLERAYRSSTSSIRTHPVWIVQAPRGTVETLKPYDPTYDVTGVDIYPINYPPDAHSAAAQQGDQHGRRLHAEHAGSRGCEKGVQAGPR